MLLNVNCSRATFENTPKVDTKATMNENKMKNQIDHGVQCLHFSKEEEKEKEKKKKNDIELRESQVVSDVNQRGHVKKKSGDLSSS